MLYVALAGREGINNSKQLMMIKVMTVFLIKGKIDLIIIICITYQLPPIACPPPIAGCPARTADARHASDCRADGLGRVPRPGCSGRSGTATRSPEAPTVTICGCCGAALRSPHLRKCTLRRLLLYYVVNSALSQLGMRMVLMMMWLGINWRTHLDMFGN